MSSYFKQLSVLILIIATQASCAQRKPKLYKVSGIVTETYSYCGGARPSEEMLAELNKPKPKAEKTLYVKSGTANSKSDKALKSFTTDAEGRFNIELPAGQYCIVDALKIADFKIPAADANHKWDVDCLTKAYAHCDYELNITAKQLDSIRINYFIPCEWNKPCLEYTGPLPPTTQQRY